MTSVEPEVEAFIEALRSDLPSEDDQRRVLARLVSAGFVSGGLALSGAAAASTTAKVGLVSKLAGLSWGVKVGLAGAVVAAVALPVAHELAKPGQGAAPSVGAAAGRADSDDSPSPRKEPESTGATEQAPPSSPAVSPNAAPSLPAGPSPRAEPGREVTREDAAPGTEAPAAGGPSVASFPEIGPPLAQAPDVRESRLREEADVIGRALSALRSGDRATAMRWLSEHALRFPDGQLRRERERARERANAMSDSGSSSDPMR